MIKFDKSQFRIEFCGLRALSKATIDPKITYVRDGGDEVKQAVPTSIARITRSKLHGVTRFHTAYPTCLAFVGDRVVSMSVPVGADYKMYQDTGDWISILETRASLVETLDDTWHWDGQYAYHFVGHEIPFGDSNLGWIKVKAINFYRFSEEKADLIEHLAALCFRDPITKKWTRTGPIARYSGDRVSLIEDDDLSSNLIKGTDLQRMDAQRFVNLRFVNYAARVLTNQFGYEVTEPLGLPLLMIEHRTFNLGGLATPVQMSSRAPLSFTQAVAWMIGLQSKARDLSDVVAIKSCMKMLLSKGSGRQFTADANKKKAQDTKSVISGLRDKYASAPLIVFGD